MPKQASSLLEVKNLKVHFPVRRAGKFLFSSKATLKAVDDVSFTLKAGETLGIVGESGCGKSTIARAILKLIPITEGSVIAFGKDLTHLSPRKIRPYRKDLQIIFQDPLAALDPRMSIGQIVGEPLKTFAPQLKTQEIQQRVIETLELVGLSGAHINRYPHEFSGGQCQRIGIARAIILKPKLIICDEAVSALDVSIQAQIINLLMDIQKKLDLSLIFISHNLSVVRHISHRIMVLYLGKIAEIADHNELFENPRHPYTKALISAIPIPDPNLEKKREKILLKEDLPSPINPPSGCPFRTRCPMAQQLCAEIIPPLAEVSPGHQSACHFWREVPDKLKI